MPSGIYIRTEYHLRRIRETHVSTPKGTHVSPSTEFKKGHQIFKDKHHSEETKKLLSKQRIGIKTGRIPKSAFKKGFTPWNKGIKTGKGGNKTTGRIPWNIGVPSKFRGIKRSEEVCKKIRLGLTGKKLSNQHRKTLSISHGGNGIAKTPYPITWDENLKKMIRDRDGHKCQICGTPEIECKRKLNVHHIDYDKNNLSPLNLISLCNICHPITSIVSNRIFYTEMLSNMLKEKYAKV